MEEEQAPVAHSDPLAQLKADTIGRVELEFDLAEEVPTRPLELLGRRRACRDRFDDFQQPFTSRIERLILPHLCGEVRRAGVVQLEVTAENLAGLFRLDQALVEAAGRCVTERQNDEIEWREIGIRT